MRVTFFAEARPIGEGSGVVTGVDEQGVCAVSDAFVRDWIWVLAFFPLWLVTSGTTFGLAYGPKQSMGVRGQKAVNAFAMFLSLSMAAGALMWLECTSHIHLPFARPACGMFPAAILSPTWL